MISPDWKHLGTYPIFENQDWVEPGETIFEEQLIVLPDDNAAAIKLELKLASSRSAWVAVTVSLLAKDEEGPTHGATATEPGATTTPATAAGRATAATTATAAATTGAAAASAGDTGTG
jgi:hypothetical protein